MKVVVEQFDSEEAVPIKKCQELLRKDSLPSDLAFVRSHLAFLPATIKSLEKAGLPLTSAMSILDSAQQKMDSIPGEKGNILQVKLHSVLHKNPALAALRKVSQVQAGESDGLPDGLDIQSTGRLKYCSVVSVDVERSFSQYKNILTDKRHNFTKDNLSKVMVTHSFYNRSETE